MASKRSAVKLTANFEANLAAIEAFWVEADAWPSYDALLDALLETVIPNLEQFPNMGRSFLDRQAQSVESRSGLARLKTRIGGSEIREYLVDDYLILYAVISGAVFLLSIRHHQQLSFDLQAFWSK